MLSYVLTLVKWPKRVQKHLQEVSKKSIQLGKTLYRFPDFINRKYFTLILKTMILTALVNSVTSTEIFKIQKQPTDAFLKVKIKVLEDSIVKLQGLGLQLY